MRCRAAGSPLGAAAGDGSRIWLRAAKWMCCAASIYLLANDEDMCCRPSCPSCCCGAGQATAACWPALLLHGRGACYWGLQLREAAAGSSTQAGPPSAVGLRGSGRWSRRRRRAARGEAPGCRAAQACAGAARVLAKWPTELMEPIRTRPAAAHSPPPGAPASACGAACPKPDPAGVRPQQRSTSRCAKWAAAAR